MSNSRLTRDFIVPVGSLCRWPSAASYSAIEGLTSITALLAWNGPWLLDSHRTIPGVGYAKTPEMSALEFHVDMEGQPESCAWAYLRLLGSQFYLKRRDRCGGSLVFQAAVGLCSILWGYLRDTRSDLVQCCVEAQIKRVLLCSIGNRLFTGCHRMHVPSLYCFCTLS